MRGRASRSEFWWFLLANYLTGFAAIAVDLTVLETRVEQTGPLEAAAFVIFLFPQFTVTVRRLHDTGRSLLYLFAPFLWFVVAIVLGALLGPRIGQPAAIVSGLLVIMGYLAPLVWLVQRSDPGTNRYGPPPLGASA